MWEFTVHRSAAGSCWTWARFGERTIQRSKRSFATWTDAFADATTNGFIGIGDDYCLTELHGKRPSSPVQHPLTPASTSV